MPYTVYILHSSQLNKYYVGQTGDELNDRIRRHLSDHKGFTSKAKDWLLVHTEIFPDRLHAAKREREIKGWKSSLRIKALILTSLH